MDSTKKYLYAFGAISAAEVIIGTWLRYDNTNFNFFAAGLLFFIVLPAVILFLARRSFAYWIVAFTSILAVGLDTIMWHIYGSKQNPFTPYILLASIVALGKLVFAYKVSFNQQHRSALNVAFISAVYIIIAFLLAWLVVYFLLKDASL